MKKINLIWLLLLLFAYGSNLKAQCSTTAYELANNYVATFHAGAAKSSDGKWYAWGEDHGGSSGSTATKVLEVNKTNYSLLPAGSVVKFVSGGSVGQNNNQLVALVSSATTASDANRIYSLVDTFDSRYRIVISSNSIPLPAGVTAADVTSFYAGYGMIAIVAGGKGYVYNNLLTNSVFGDGTTTGTGTWGTSVKSSAAGNPEITNFVSIRGASVDAATDTGVLIGLTSDGKVYTWGNQTFIGGGTAVANYTRATLATPTPATAGAKVTLVGANYSGGASLYAMFDNGEFWSIGKGGGGRLGDFGTADQTSWVRVKRSNPTAPATDYANVVYFTTQEHDGLKTDGADLANQASVQMKLSDDSIYGFGRDGGYILGVGSTAASSNPSILRNDATATGTIDGSTATRTGLAIEMGGHISFMYKESGSFCIAGHGSDGSLLGTNNSAFNEYFSTCATTAAITPCPIVFSKFAAVPDDLGTINAGTTTTTSLITNDKNSADTTPVIGTSAGQVAISTVTDAAGTSGTWPAGFTLNSDGTIAVASTVSAGSYTLYYKICEQTALTLCSTAKITLTVAACVSPSISAQPLATQTVCNGGSTTALSVTAAGTGTLSYQWYSNTTNSTSGGTLITGATSSSYSPSASNTGASVQTIYYYVVVTGTCGTTTSSTAAVVVRPTPTATISGTTSTCQNSTPSPNITFTNPQSNPITVTYNINGGASQTINVAANSTANVSAPTTTAGTFNYNLVSVAYQTAPICSATVSGTATVTIKAAPTLTVATTPVACIGDNTGSATITASGGTSPYTYSKDGTTYQASNTFANLNAATYTFYVKDASGCISSATATVSQGSSPIAATVNAGILLCNQVKSDLTVTPTTGAVSDYQYQIIGSVSGSSGWQNSNQFTNISQQSYKVYIRLRSTGGNCTYLGTFTPENPCTEVTKTADKTSVSAVGEIVTYTITVKNTGQVDLKNVTVTDTKVGLVATIATFVAGATQTYTKTYAVTQADLDACSLINTVSFSATTPQNNTITDSAQNTISVLNTASWSITKSITSGTTYTAVGNVIQYKIVVKNTGTTTIKNIAVTDANAIISSTYTGETGTVGELSPNEEWTYTASHTINSSDLINACNYTNSATASGTPYCGTLANITSNTVTSNKVIAAPIVGAITQATCSSPKGSVLLSGLPASGSWTVTAYNGATAVGTITGTDTSSASFNGLDAGATYTFKVAQPIGCESAASSGAVLNALVGCACYENPALDVTTTYPSKHGITLLKRAGSENGSWPMIRQSAHTVLESNSKGFVITRMPTADLSNISKPVVGMMVYDTTAQCLKIYTGDTTNPWKCFTTPGCPN